MQIRIVAVGKNESPQFLSALFLFAAPVSSRSAISETPTSLSISRYRCVLCRCREHVRSFQLAMNECATTSESNVPLLRSRRPIAS
jgi:hypothetical protein